MTFGNVSTWEELSSPNYPDPYGDGLSCSWLFKAPIGKRIEIEFLPPVFSLPTDVMHGYVELKGTDDPGLTGLRLFGRELPAPTLYVSETNQLVVLLRDFSRKAMHRGFRAHVRTTSKKATLHRRKGRTISAAHQTINPGAKSESEGPENANPNKSMGSLSEG